MNYATTISDTPDTTYFFMGGCAAGNANRTISETPHDGVGRAMSFLLESGVYCRMVTLLKRYPFVSIFGFPRRYLAGTLPSELKPKRLNLWDQSPLISRALEKLTYAGTVSR